MCCFAHIQSLSNNDNLQLPLCRNKNNLVRSTASRLLTLVVITSGADTVLGPRALRVFRHDVISAAASFLEDANTDARYGICFNCCQVIWRQHFERRCFLSSNNFSSDLFSIPCPLNYEKSQLNI